MSAVRAPKNPEPGHRPDAEPKTPEERRIADLVERRDRIEGRYRISPVRQMQAELVERLSRPKAISIGAVLAMLIVLCLSMSFAALVLLASV